MIRVGIVGISGYSGMSALEILLKHPEARVSYISANNTEGPLETLWPQFNKETKLICKKFNSDEAIENCDVVLLAVPHTVAMTIVPQLLKAKKRVIDFSGDYRLKTAEDYKKWYGVDHIDSRYWPEAVYGLAEFNREDIKKAALVANPGCYPTAALLALAPIATSQAGNIASIVIDAKSGVSGAGRKATLNFSFVVFKRQ